MLQDVSLKDTYHPICRIENCYVCRFQKDNQH